jgi:hypothetical protein
LLGGFEKVVLNFLQIIIDECIAYFHGKMLSFGSFFHQVFLGVMSRTFAIYPLRVTLRTTSRMSSLLIASYFR